MADTAAHTLFVVGNPDGFRRTGHRITQLLENPKGFLYQLKGHSCRLMAIGRLRSWEGRHGTSGFLHIEYRSSV